MKVKAVQIARELGISKATVSLALNNKPGVGEQTRQEVLACKKRLEAGEEPEKSGKKDSLIKVVNAVKGLNIAYNSEIDLWTDVLTVFDREAKKRGYGLSVSYIDVRKDSIEEAVQDCNSANTAGVILHATELNEEEMRKFEGIRAPMIVYDNESSDLRHNCVVADNYRGMKRAVRYLLEKGHKDIIYLKNQKEIYNFRQRRKGFCDALSEYNINPYKDESMIPIGTTIDSVYNNMKNYLATHDLPEACIMENYQVSIGVMRALTEKEIAVPKQISLIGVDVVPAYMTGGCALTTVRIPHTERALLAILLLDKEIEEQSCTKSRVMTDCRLVEGESTAKKV